MISAKFLCGNVFFGGKLQIDAKNSNFKIFERALYLKSVSMPLSILNSDWLQHAGSVWGVNESKWFNKRFVTCVFFVLQVGPVIFYIMVLCIGASVP